MAQKDGAVVIRGNKLSTVPGYSLQKSRSDQILIKRGGDTGDSVECICDKAGDCVISTADDVAVCSKSPTAPCAGSCSFDNVIVSP